MKVRGCPFSPTPELEYQMFSLRLAGVSFVLLIAVACGRELLDPAHNSFTHTHSRPHARRGDTGGHDSSACRGARQPCLRASRAERSGRHERHLDQQRFGRPHSGLRRARLEFRIIPPRRTFSVTFQTAGTFRYHRGIHQGMVGRVTAR
jgi:plastocyanin